MDTNVVHLTVQLPLNSLYNREFYEPLTSSKCGENKFEKFTNADDPILAISSIY